MSNILEELDRWLENWHGGSRPTFEVNMVRSARDEIAALRKIALWDRQVRNEALEEAALAAEACCREFPACGVAVAVIRGLKR